MHQVFGGSPNDNFEGYPQEMEQGLVSSVHGQMEAEAKYERVKAPLPHLHTSGLYPTSTDQYQACQRMQPTVTPSPDHQLLNGGQSLQNSPSSMSEPSNGPEHYQNISPSNTYPQANYGHSQMEYDTSQAMRGQDHVSFNTVDMNLQHFHQQQPMHQQPYASVPLHPNHQHYSFVQPTAEIHLDNDSHQFNPMVYPSGGLHILHHHPAPAQSPLADTSDSWTSYGISIHPIDMDKTELDYVMPSQRIPTWNGA